MFALIGARVAFYILERNHVEADSKPRFQDCRHDDCKVLYLKKKKWICQYFMFKLETLAALTVPVCKRARLACWKIFQKRRNFQLIAPWFLIPARECWIESSRRDRRWQRNQIFWKSTFRPTRARYVHILRVYRRFLWCRSFKNIIGKHAEVRGEQASSWDSRELRFVTVCAMFETEELFQGTAVWKLGSFFTIPIANALFSSWN